MFPVCGQIMEGVVQIRPMSTTSGLHPSKAVHFRLDLFDAVQSVPMSLPMSTKCGLPSTKSVPYSTHLGPCPTKLGTSTKIDRTQASSTQPGQISTKLGLYSFKVGPSSTPGAEGARKDKWAARIRALRICHALTTILKHALEVVAELVPSWDMWRWAPHGVDMARNCG